MKTTTKMQNISDFFEDSARDGNGLYAIAFAILELAEAQSNLANHVKYLGNGDAATTMGAIEAFGVHIGEKIEGLAIAIGNIGEAS